MIRSNLKNIFIGLSVVLLVIIVVFIYKKNPVDNTPIIITTKYDDVTKIIKAGLKPEDIKRLDEKIAKIQEKITNNTAISPDYIDLGVDYMAYGELQKALDSFIKAKDLNSDHYLAYSNIASVYQMMKEPEKAEEYLLEAVKRAPNVTDAYLKLGELYRYDLNKTQAEVKQLYLESLQRTGDHPDVARAFASYLEDEGLLEDELKIWQGLEKIEPENKAIKDKIAEIQKELESKK